MKINTNNNIITNNNKINKIKMIIIIALENINSKKGGLKKDEKVICAT